MKKFLLKLSFFLLVLLSLSSILDWGLTQSLKTSTRYNYGEWNDIFKGNIDAGLAIYGSSRAWRHFDPKILEDSLKIPVYNLGLDGYQFHMQYARHLLYFKHNKHPKNIILSLDYWTLGKTSELYMDEQFLPYLNDSIIRKYTSTYVGFNFWDYHLPFVRYFGNTKEIVHAFDLFVFPKHNYSVKYKGFQGNQKKWSQDLNKARVAIKSNKELNSFHGNSIDFTTDKETVALFEMFLEEMKRKKIQVLFVISPIYSNGQKLIKGHDGFVQKFKQYANKYNYPFFDYSKDPMCSSKDNFYNITHMNAGGASLFTSKLAKDIKPFLKK